MEGTKNKELCRVTVCISKFQLCVGLPFFVEAMSGRNRRR